jgi:hypothetical protein
MRALRFAPICLLLTLGAAPLAAQTNCGSGTTTTNTSFNSAGCTVSHTVSATVPFLASIGAVASSFTITAPTATEMAAGFTAQSAGPALSISANFAFTVTATASAFNTVSGYTKPLTDFELNSNTTNTVSGTWVNLSTQRTLLSSSPASATTMLYTWFRMKLTWNLDRPGTYTSTVTYTLTAP